MSVRFALPISVLFAYCLTMDSAMTVREYEEAETAAHPACEACGQELCARWVCGCGRQCPLVSRRTGDVLCGDCLVAWENA